jgi:inosine-uridine nucleoside N-ribohydrolase
MRPCPTSVAHMTLHFAGHDDAVAIMVVASHPKMDLLGVSTVACNQTVEKTTANALATLEACGRSDVPVFQGQHKPLMRHAPLCPEIHGETGEPSRFIYCS